MPRIFSENNFKRIPPIWVHAAALLAVAAWGTSFVNSSVLLNDGFSPVEVYVFRCIIAYVVLLSLSFRHLRALNAQHELLFLLCGICGGSIYFVAENYALVYTTAANVSLITSTSPLINALLVFIVYKDEKPGRGFIFGSLVAMAGVVMVVLGGNSAHESTSTFEHSMLGDVLSLLAAVCWSIYAVLLRKLQAFYSALVVTRKTFFYGIITALPFMLLTPSQLTAETFTQADVWINLLFLALVASSLSFVIWAWVISRIGAVKAGNYLYFQPVFTLIFGYLVLHEATSIVGLIGCAVTIVGVYLGENLSDEQRRLHH